MYLGESPAVENFAKEFVARKRAARGTGESVEWQTCALAPTPPTPPTRLHPSRSLPSSTLPLPRG